MICLPKDSVESFKKAIISGKINPEKLANMTSEARHKLFADIVGEGEAKWVNATFESKTLLKNQQLGYTRWAQKLVGVPPEVKRDLISRIQKMDKVLNPTEEKAFLKDLASTRLGADVTAQEAKKITLMSSKLQELEAKKRSDGTFPSESDRMAYGYAKTDLGSYLSDLKNRAEKSTIKEQALHPIQTGSKLAGFSKAIRASLDDSAVFRQGWKTVWTNPVTWQRNARKSVSDLLRQGVLKRDIIREVNADIVSRPNFDKYKKMGLAVGNVEEEFPTTLPEKIPLLGRAYKASESAYTAFLYRTRADVADKMLQVAEKSGVDLNDKEQLKSIGKMINALTGRGHLESNKLNTINNVLFSPRFIKSNFDTLTAHQLQKGVTPFVRKQAAMNLAKITLGTAAVLALADHLHKGSVEWDPTSKDFGKIKVGHTRFDVSGGMGSMITLAAQIARNQEKSTSTGIVSKFGQGYGAKTGLDAINNYFENKTAPVAGVVKDLIQRKDFNGNPVTVKTEATNLLLPLPAQTTVQAHGDKQAANQLLISIADGLGIATNTYGKSSKNFDNTLPDSTTLQQFKAKVGQDKFTQANKDYNNAVDKWMKDHRGQLNTLPQDQQQDTLNSIKTKLQHNVYKQYGFKYKATKPTGTKKTLLSTVK